MYASANIEFGFQPVFKGTGGSGWFKVRFRISRFSLSLPPALTSSLFPFFSAVACSPIFAGNETHLKGILFATNAYIRG